MWIAADFECRNVPVRNANSRQSLPAESTSEIYFFWENLFVYKRFAIGYNTVKKNPYCNDLN